jgi:hypothetical protein
MDETHDYQEIPPDAELTNFHLEDTAQKRFIAKVYARLTNAIRGAGVMTLFPNGGEGECLFDEEGLFRCFAVESGEERDLCRIKAGGRVIMRTADERERRTFWTEADVIESGILWLHDNAIARELAHGLIEEITPAAVWHLIPRRHEPEDAIFTGLTEMETVEMVAMVEDIVANIFPGFPLGADDTDDDDQSQQLDLIKSEV